MLFERARIGLMSEIIKKAQSLAQNRCQYFTREGARCKMNAIQSHTLQKKGPLASIAEESHVLKVGEPLRASHPDERELFYRIGLRKASSFPAFCAEHDSELFRPIETGDFDLTRGNLLRLAIRAVAMENYKKLVMVAMFDEMMRRKDDLLNPDTEFMRLSRKGAAIAVTAGEKRIRELFSDLHRGPNGRLLYVAARLEGILPIAVTGAFDPEISMGGQVLFHEDPSKMRWNYLFTFVGNIGHSANLVCGGYQKYRNHRLLPFLEEIADRQSFVSRFCAMSLAYCENVYVKPSFVYALSPSEQTVYRRLAVSGLEVGWRNSTDLALRPTIPEPSIKELVVDLTGSHIAP